RLRSMYLGGPARSGRATIVRATAARMSDRVPAMKRLLSNDPMMRMSRESGSVAEPLPARRLPDHHQTLESGGTFLRFVQAIVEPWILGRRSLQGSARSS